METKSSTRNKLICLEEFIGPPQSASFIDEVETHFPMQYENATRKVYTEGIEEGELSNILGLEESLSFIMYTADRVSSVVNNWLRSLAEGNKSKGLYSHFVSTLYSGFVKLSRCQKQPPQHLYGVLKQDQLASYTSRDESGFQGGVSYTFTSFSCKKETAVLFARSLPVIDVEERLEDEGGIHRGIAIPHSLTYYPEEDEYMFPPLTVYQVKKIETIGPTTYIVVDPIYRPNVHLPLLSPTEEIWNAVLKGNVEEVRKWLSSNVSVNLEEIHPKYECCLLYSAARFGKLEIVKALVEGCSFIDTQASKAKSTPLHAACYFGYPQVVDYLLSQGANPYIKNAYSLEPKDDLLENKELSMDIKNQILTKFKAFTKTTEKVIEVKMAVTYLVYGNRLSFLEGISQILGLPNLTMEQEFKRGIIFTERYAGTVNTMDLWEKAIEELPQLKKHENAKELTDDEIKAAFLYTTAAYKVVNDFLRELIPSKNRNELLKPSKTWVATVTHINSAIRKLSKLTTKNFPTVWRGVTMPLNPDFFVPDKRGLICATEYAFMSTSLLKEKATEFATDGNIKHATIFCIKCRAEDPGGYHMGASLKWCSQVPGEEEVLFPPLTLFEVLKRERKGFITTITVAPSFI